MTLRRITFTFICLLLVALFIPSSPRAESPADGEFLILLTNDDGYNAPGLRALAQALATLGKVIVAAPVDNQSATGHGTTSRQFVQVRPIEVVPGVTGLAIAARPATCTRLGLEVLVPQRPDLVVSGINRGTNLGIVSFYSGTVGAAREAVFVGVPAIAVSMQGDAAEDYVAAAAFVRQLVEQLRAEGRLQPGLFLNVNVPAKERRGVRLTRQSTTPTPETFTPFSPRRGYEYYWSDYEGLKDDEEGTDLWAVAHGFISVTPMQIDQTHSADFEWLRKLGLEAAPTPAP